MDKNLPDVMQKLVVANELFQGYKYPDRCTDSIEYCYRHRFVDEIGYEGPKLQSVAEQSFAEDPSRPPVAFVIGETVKVYGFEVVVKDYSNHTEWDEEDQVHVTHWTVEIGEIA